jgi:hypothetical protein
MAKKSNSEIKIIDEAQKDYLDMTTDEQKEVCLKSIQLMASNLNTAMGKQYTNPDVFVDILEVTIKRYETTEEYEACIILRDMIKMIKTIDGL